MNNYFIKWFKDRYLFEIIKLILKFQGIYLALVILGDFGNEIGIGIGTIFKLAALVWCGFSVYTYFKNETRLKEEHSLNRPVLFMFVLVIWCVLALVWGALITKLATIDWWIVPQNGLSINNPHNGGEYMTMACALVCETLVGALILKALQRFWWPYNIGQDEEVSPVLKKIAGWFLKEPSKEFGFKICIIVIVFVVLFSIYPIIDLFVLTSDNVVNSDKDFKKYFEEKYNIEIERAEVYKNFDDHKYYRYESTGSKKHSINIEQTYVEPGVFEKGSPRWEVSIVMDGEEIEIE